jgi:hypothetical protein
MALFCSGAGREACRAGYHCMPARWPAPSTTGWSRGRCRHAQMAVLIDSDHQPKVVRSCRLRCSHHRSSSSCRPLPALGSPLSRAPSATLQEMPSVLISVSMAGARHRRPDAERAAGYIAAFVRRTGWRPAAVHHAAGARLYAISAGLDVGFCRLSTGTGVIPVGTTNLPTGSPSLSLSTSGSGSLSTRRNGSCGDGPGSKA